MHWQSKYELGHPKIDMEHRIFFDLVQAVSEASKNGASRDKLRRLIAELQKYAEFHFLSEENIMMDVGYPGFSEHHEHHQKLLHDLRHFIIAFEAETSPDVSELVDFLVNWFLNHTTREDLQLINYLTKQSS